MSIHDLSQHDLSRSRSRGISLPPAWMLLVVVCFSGVVFAAPAPAPAQPDVIVFTNGDQLSGKFVRSAGGNISFHSDVAGDVTLPWDKVKEIRSSTQFVVIRKGARLQGKHAVASPPEGTIKVENKQIQVTFNHGGASDTIPISHIDYVIDRATYDREMSRKIGLLSGWTGNATAGATIVAATQNSYTFSGGFSLARVEPSVAWLDPRDRMETNFQGSFGKVTQPGVPAVKTAIYHLDAQRDEFFSPRFYALGQAAFDHNFSQNLDLQQIYGGGIGRIFIKQPNQTLDAKATLQYERQAFLSAVAGSNQNLIGSTFSVSYMRKLPKGIVFTQELSYLPAWNNLYAYSATEANTFALPLYKRLSFSVGTLDSYLNDPPLTSPPTKRNSFQFTMGATYSFAGQH